MTKNAILASLLALVSTSFAQTAANKPPAGGSAPSTSSAPSSPAATPKAPGLPTEAQVNAALERTLGYDAGLHWDILDIHPSILPGVAEVLVSLNKQPANRLLIPQDGQNAIIVADVIPFGTNPFAPARSKLQAADGPGKGSQNPQILIVDFSDLQCPHCKAAEPVLEKLLTDFPQVRFVFQQFPLPASLHPWAMKAAEYADCAGRMNKEAFWKYINAVFENQGGIALATADDQLKGFATEAGLDGAKLAACAAAPETEARVKKSVDLGQSLDVNETPTVFVNGRRVRSIGTMPYEQLKALVQFEIDHAGK
jgi:protein-disulfide isomerase